MKGGKFQIALFKMMTDVELACRIDNKWEVGCMSPVYDHR